MRAAILALVLALLCPGTAAAKCAGDAPIPFFEMASMSSAVADVTIESVNKGRWKLRINEVVKGALKAGELLEVLRPMCTHEPENAAIVPGSRWVMTLNAGRHRHGPPWTVPICGVFAARIVEGKVEVASDSGTPGPLRLDEVKARITPPK